MKKRKTYSAGFKTKIVLEALQERETVQEIARKYEIHPSQISTWKSQFLSNASTVFEKGASKNDDDKEKDALFKKVGQLQLENDFLKKVQASTILPVSSYWRVSLLYWAELLFLFRYIVFVLSPSFSKNPSSIPFFKSRLAVAEEISFNMPM